ncbi:MAG TPA: transglycosylase domain-containing protein [Kofleriaceae bacterium]|nr:transglycosylase domain-containing protein [Kofleriaceae bacterium]
MRPLPRMLRVLRATWRWTRRALIAGAALALLAAGGLAIAVLGWDYPALSLSPDRGGPLLLVDRNGLALARLPAADGRPGRDAWVALDRVPAIAVATILVSEDERFFEHGGVDLRGLGRAAWLNLRERRLGYGGSTITMQLARMLHSPGQERTLRNKLREAVLAMRLERALDKRAILEQYLNRACFGNGAYGIEAAARTYFGKPAASLSAGEATLLAVVPRAPSAYDPVRRLGAAIERREHVFGLLAGHGALSPAEIGRARAERLAPGLRRPERRAPHFVDWVLGQLPADVRAAGGTVVTTLDLHLQERMEAVVAEHVASLAHRNVDQAGLVVLDTGSGEVRAMVGSAGHGGPGGQINITTWRRHPGSALKPFVYALAIEAGDGPASIAHDIHDVPSAYRVKLLTQPERGPVRYREALAGSYNLAAVHTLEKVGVERMMTVMRRAGVGPLAGSADDYGLRLALGSAQVRLLDLASAYGFVARGGRVRRAAGVHEVTSWAGAAWRPEQPRDVRIFSPQTSWLVMDIMADAEARRPAFGQELPVDLPFRVAFKTGTARGFADTVAIGVTRELTVAAWAGTFDGVPTQGLVAMDAAAPLVRAGLLAGGGGRDLTLPGRPDGIESGLVCPLSGLRPGSDCPHRKLEQFAAGRAPGRDCDWHRREGGRLVVHYPPEARAWAERQSHRGGRHLTAQR